MKISKIIYKISKVSQFGKVINVIIYYSMEVYSIVNDLEDLPIKS